MKENLIARLWRHLVALGPASAVAAGGLRYSFVASLHGVAYDPAAVATAQRVMRALVRATRSVVRAHEGAHEIHVGGGWRVLTRESETRIEYLLAPPRSAGAAAVAAVYLDRYTYLRPPYCHWSWRYGWVRPLGEARAEAAARREARREAHTVYLARLTEAAEVVARGGYFERADGPRGGTVRLPAWPLDARVSAATVAQRAGVEVWPLAAPDLCREASPHDG